VTEPGDSLIEQSRRLRQAVAREIERAAAACERVQAVQRPLRVMAEAASSDSADPGVGAREVLAVTGLDPVRRDRTRPPEQVDPWRGDAGPDR
jgi:hypothetical protein